MANAVYKSDLVPILEEFPSTTGWLALGGGAAQLAAPETDIFIQGANCISKQAWTAGAHRGMIYDTGGSIAVTSGNAIFMWAYYMAPNSLLNENSGGMQMLVGNTTTDYKHYSIRGADTYQYGGWFCVPVDPLRTTDVYTSGTPTATVQTIGLISRLAPGLGPSKGNPHVIDAFRTGKTFYVVSGDSSNPGIFSGAASVNDFVGSRFGLFQRIDGGFLHQGLMKFGSGAAAFYFNDSNKSISIADTRKVNANFNGYEVKDPGSLFLTNISITALGSTSKGNFITSGNPIVSLDTCTFTDMGTFIYNTNGSNISTTFRRCGSIIQSGARFNDCLFDKSYNSSALLANNLDSILNCTFIGSWTHGIELTNPGTYTLTGVIFTGSYADADGSTGSEMIYNNSAGAVTINIAGNGTIPTIRDGAGASTSVIANVVSLEVANLLTGDEPTNYARVYIAASGTAGPESHGTLLLSGLGSVVDGGTYKAVASYSYSTPQAVVIKARYKGFLPFTTKGTITDGGLSVNAIWLSDPNFT